MELRKIAIALKKEVVDELNKMDPNGIIKNRYERDKVKIVYSGKEQYAILFWDWESVDESYERFRRAIESVKHSILEADENGSLFSDIETDDEYGYDEEFDYILGWSVNFHLYGDPRDIIV